MGCRSDVSMNKKNIALGLVNEGSRAYDVARRFGCNKRLIYRLQQRILNTGNINDLLWSGRPRITTPRENRYMVTSLSRHRFIPATIFCSVSDRLRGSESVFRFDRNRLRAAKLRAQRPYIHVDVPLTKRHRAARLDWLRQHNCWVRHPDNHVVIKNI